MNWCNYIKALAPRSWTWIWIDTTSTCVCTGSTSFCFRLHRLLWPPRATQQSFNLPTAVLAKMAFNFGTGTFPGYFRGLANNFFGGGRDAGADAAQQQPQQGPVQHHQPAAAVHIAFVSAVARSSAAPARACDRGCTVSIPADCTSAAFRFRLEQATSYIRPTAYAGSTTIELPAAGSACYTISIFSATQHSTCCGYATGSPFLLYPTTSLPNG